MNVLNDAEWMMEDCKGDYSLAARLWRRSRHYCSTKDTYVRQVPTNASSLRTTCTVRKRMYRYIEKEARSARFVHRQPHHSLFLACQRKHCHSPECETILKNLLD